jgi:hypothetical protein
MDSKHRMGLVVGIGFALAACSSRVACAQAPSDACALLTPAQVSTILGVTVGAGHSLSTTVCAWSTPGREVTSTHAQVSVKLTLLDVTAFPVERETLLGVTMWTSVSGIGEDAVYATYGRMTPPQTHLSVKKGKVDLEFELLGVQGQDKQMAMEKALALDVLARL